MLPTCFSPRANWAKSVKAQRHEFRARAGFVALLFLPGFRTVSRRLFDRRPDENGSWSLPSLQILFGAVVETLLSWNYGTVLCRSVWRHQRAWSVPPRQVPWPISNWMANGIHPATWGRGNSAGARKPFGADSKRETEGAVLKGLNHRGESFRPASAMPGINRFRERAKAETAKSSLSEAPPGGYLFFFQGDGPGSISSL